MPARGDRDKSVSLNKDLQHELIRDSAVYDVWMIQASQSEDDSSHDMTPDTVHRLLLVLAVTLGPGREILLVARRQLVAGGGVARGAADRLGWAAAVSATCRYSPQPRGGRGLLFKSRPRSAPATARQWASWSAAGAGRLMPKMGKCRELELGGERESSPSPSPAPGQIGADL